MLWYDISCYSGLSHLLYSLFLLRFILNIVGSLARVTPDEPFDMCFSSQNRPCYGKIALSATSNEAANFHRIFLTSSMGKDVEKFEESKDVKEEERGKAHNSMPSLLGQFIVAREKTLIHLCHGNINTQLQLIPYFLCFFINLFLSVA